MTRYEFDHRPITNEVDFLDYFIDAINYRNKHKDESREIAIHVYSKTQPPRLPFPLSDEFDDLRFEFIALEAPGMPEDNEKDPAEYDDEVWQRLLNIVTKIKVQRLNSAVAPRENTSQNHSED